MASKPFQKETKIRFQDDEKDENTEEPQVDSGEMAKAKTASDGPQVDPIQKRMLEMAGQDVELYMTKVRFAPFPIF